MQPLRYKLFSFRNGSTKLNTTVRVVTYKKGLYGTARSFGR